MLRACQEVLSPGGRLAGYVIHAPSGQALAAELGPSEVLADESPDALHRAAGFKEVIAHDVTSDFTATCEAFLAAGRAMRAESEDGTLSPEVEEELELKSLMLDGILRGLLRRCLVVARKADP